MKYYYAACTINFTENLPNEEPWNSFATYNFIIEAENKKEGKILAKERGMEEFELDLGNDFDNIELVIDTFYETTEDARAD